MDLGDGDVYLARAHWLPDGSLGAEVPSLILVHMSTCGVTASVLFVRSKAVISSNLDFCALTRKRELANFCSRRPLPFGSTCTTSSTACRVPCPHFLMPKHLLPRAASRLCGAARDPCSCTCTFTLSFPELPAQCWYERTVMITLLGPSQCSFPRVGRRDHRWRLDGGID
jgi:hypothetical protein